MSQTGQPYTDTSHTYCDTAECVRTHRHTTTKASVGGRRDPRADSTDSTGRCPVAGTLSSISCGTTKTHAWGTHKLILFQYAVAGDEWWVQDGERLGGGEFSLSCQERLERLECAPVASRHEQPEGLLSAVEPELPTSGMPTSIRSPTHQLRVEVLHLDLLQERGQLGGRELVGHGARGREGRSDIERR